MMANLFQTISFLRNLRLSPYIITQLRWKKQRIRKPLWLPVAPSKLYRIPEHPYVPPDEADLILDLLDEYYRHIDSLRKLFQEEIKQESFVKGSTEERNEKESVELRCLLEENKLENERIREIRERTLEQLFEAKQYELLKLDEERKKKEEKIKEQVDSIVREEKKKQKSILTHDNLDAAIEYALDNPVNINFAINIRGEILWEENPPRDLKDAMTQRIVTATQS